MTSPVTDLLGTVTLDGAGQPVVAFDRRYAAAPADLWDAVTDPDRLARWFAPVEGDLVEGGTFTMRFDDGDIPSCRIVRCDAPRAFSWEWPQDEQSSLVEVQILPDGAASRLRLTHTRLTVSGATGYGAGWDIYLRHLGDHLAGREPTGWWDSFAETRQAYAALLD